MSDIVYAVVKPPCHIIKIETPQGQEQYDNLVKAALARGHELYATTLEEGEFCSVPKMPWILQEYTKTPQPSDSVVNLNELIVCPNEFLCPYCSKVLRSASGKTLHIKQKHLKDLQVDKHGNMGANSSNS